MGLYFYLQLSEFWQQQEGESIIAASWIGGHLTEP
jgi:hypothetical protein